MLESDWKLFRRSLSAWRERYLERINAALTASLREEGKTPTERFWQTHRAARAQARILEDCFDGLSRSKQKERMVSMLHHGIITGEDLQAFSDECRNDLAWVLEILAQAQDEA